VVKAGFLSVTLFASLLGVATIIHWDKVNHGHVRMRFPPLFGGDLAKVPDPVPRVA